MPNSQHPPGRLIKFALEYLAENLDSTSAFYLLNSDAPTEDDIDECVRSLRSITPDGDSEADCWPVAPDLLAALHEIYRPGRPQHDAWCPAVRGAPHNCTCMTGRHRAAIAKAKP